MFSHSRFKINPKSNCLFLLSQGQPFLPFQNFHVNKIKYYSCWQLKQSNQTTKKQINNKLECGPMPNVMVDLPNIGGVLCSTPQSLADAHYQNAMQ